MKKSSKTQHGRIPINPAILAAIGHRFRATKKKLKMSMPRSEAMRAETRNWILFWPYTKALVHSGTPQPKVIFAAEIYITSGLLQELMQHLRNK